MPPLRDMFQESINEARLLDSDLATLPVHVVEILLGRDDTLPRYLAAALHQAHVNAVEQTRRESRSALSRSISGPEIGGKIAAIKALRVATDMSLREAKDAIEAELEKLGYGRKWRDSDE